MALDDLTRADLERIRANNPERWKRLRAQLKEEDPRRWERLKEYFQNAAGEGGTDTGGGGGSGGGDGDPLTGDDRDAYAALLDYFEGFGLGSLAPLIQQYLIEGFSGPTITLKLQETDTYKQRFAGNELIKKAIADGTADPGLRVLSPEEYLSQEKQYRDVLSYFGLPAGFYDSPDDFAQWIGKGVSVLEVQDRARLAKEAVNNSTQEFKDQLREYYGVTEGDLTAYFLDQKRTLPILEARAAAAQIGGAAAYQGLDVDRQRAEELAAFGVSKEQAQQGYAAIGSILPDAEKLAAIDEVQYSQRDAEEEVFRGSADAAKKRKRLSENEKARFSTSGGNSKYSFAQDKGDY